MGQQIQEIRFFRVADQWGVELNGQPYGTFLSLKECGKWLEQLERDAQNPADGLESAIGNSPIV